MNLNFYPKAKLTLASFKKSLLFSLVAVLSLGYSYAQGPATALGFDGLSNIVNVPASPTLNLSAAITLEAWVYPTKSSTSVQDVISKSSSAVNNGYIFPRFTKRLESLQFWVNINGYGWQTLTVPYGEDKLNQWHHLAATYDGYFMTIYIDGVLAGTQAFAGTMTVNNNALTIGGQNGYSEFFGGKVDEARIWSRALTPCEINNNITCELNGPQTGLSAYYKFNQGLLNLPNLFVTTATDASGNGNDGTLSGFLLTGLLSNWAQGTVSGTCSVWTPVTATASSVKSVIAVGSDINLLATGTAGATYSWVGPNGYTSNQQNPTLSHVGTNASGTYTVTVSKGGCSASASTTVTVALLGGALNFNTTDNVVTIPNSPSLNPTNAISIETWINPSSTLPTVQDVISKSGKYINTGYIFPRTDDGWRSFSFWLDIGGDWKVLSAQYPAINQWNHVAATYDGFYMKIYLNGVLKGSLAVSGAIVQNGNNLLIGQQADAPENYKGSIDEARIWSRAISQCEIQNNMSCELNGGNNGLATQTGLAAYYRFNQGLVGVDNTATTVLADSSSNHNNGTLSPFTLNGASSNWISGNVIATCSAFVAQQATAGSNGPNIEVGNTINLTASAGTTWSWTGPNNFTSTLQNPSITNAGLNATGTYTVSITGGGCTNVASTQVSVAYKAGTLGFDGVNDKVVVPNSPSLNISKTITIESWIYPTSNVGVQDVMSKSTQDVNSGYIFPRTNDGWRSITFYLHLNGSFKTLTAPYPGINQWHHAAATYDGYFMRIYIDGVLVATSEVAGNITVNGNDLVLGSQPGFGEFFSGQVDESRIWSRALNQCEIINNMNCELDPAQKNNLVAYYKYNQGFAGVDNTGINTLTDASDNANTGTLTNFALNGTTSNWSPFKITTTCSVFAMPPVTATANATVFGIGSTIQLFATGGNTYTWNGPNSFTSTNANPTIGNATVNASGTYTVTAPFVNCVVYASTRLDVSTLAAITASGPTTFCPSSTVDLNISNSGSAYQWYRNGVLISGATAATYTASQSGDYTVAVTNGTDVFLSAPITLTVVDNLPPVVPTLPTLNLVTPATVTAAPTATDNCRGTVTGTTTSPTSFNTPGTYTITWKFDDQNGNVVTQDQQVVVVMGVDNVPPVLTVPANITTNATIADCGAVVNFTATATDNSASPVTITYSQNPGTVFTSGTTTVTVTATDAANNITTGSFTVTVIPVAGTVTGTNTVCAGSTAALATTLAGGTWSSNNTAVATVNASGVVTGLSAGTAVITYANACGSSASATVTVNAVPSAPTVTVVNNCGSSTLTASNTTGSILWSNNATTASITVSNAASYSVTQTANGCTSASASGTSAPKASPAAPVIMVTNNCGSTTLTVPAGNCTFSWNTTPATTGNTVTVNAAGTYTVTATNTAGCTSVASATITVTAVPSAPTVTVVNNCGSSTLTASNTTGTLSWNTTPVSTGSSITVSNAGTYSVTQTVNGCTSVSASGVAAPKAVPSAPTVTVVNNCGSSTLTASNTTGTLSWNTTPVSTGASITVSNAGTYSVTQTVNGCTSASASGVAAPKAVPSAPVITVTNNCGSTTLSVPAGNTYSWNTTPATSGTSITVTSAGTYTVTGTNTSGCSSSASATVTINTAPAVASITGTTTVNIGATTQLSDATAGGVWSSNSANATVNASGLVTSVSGGTATITYTVTNNGCSASTSTTVTVNACTAPAIAAVSNITVNTTSAQCSVAVTYTTTVTGTPAPVISYTFTGATTGANAGNGSGSVFNLGTTTVTVKATNSCGTVSTTFTVTVKDATAPTALTKNITVSLDATGQVTVTPSQVDNGSYDNCSGVTLAFKTSGAPTVTTGTINATSDENGNLQLTAPAGGTITAINFASYGTPNGTAGSFTIGACNATNSKSIVEGYALGQNSVTIPANNSVFGDPCYGTFKRLYVTATYQMSVAGNTTTASSVTFNCSKIGANTVTLNVTDASGNVSTQTATVTVLSTATVVTGISNQSFCGNTGSYTVPAISATNNCGITSVTYAVTGATSRNGSGLNASGTFNVGVSAITWTITDGSGRTSSTSATVTVSGAPVATIAAGGSSNDFCSDITLTGSSSVSNATYKWMFGSTVVGTSQQYSVGQSSAEGTYQLYVTTPGGCTSAAASYNFQKQNLLSSYTILVYDDVSIGKYNKVATGSIGVMSSWGDADFESYTSVNGPNSFVKGPDINLNGTGINITRQINGIVSIPLPAMQYTTGNPRNYSNYSTAQYSTVTLNNNYNYLTVKKGTYATLNGTVFGTIELEQGASIRFTNSTVNIDNLLVDDGARDGYYSYVRFAPNSSIRVSTKVSIGSQVLVNPDNNKVTFYVGSNSCNGDRFTVRGADTKVIANIMMPSGRLEVTSTDYDNDSHSNCNHAAHSSWNCPHKGHDHKDCDHKSHDASTCNDDVYMTGMFIVEDLDSKGNTVIWNSFDCSSGTVPVTVINKATPAVLTNSIKAETTDVSATTEEELKITVMPNPSTTYFTLKFESKYETPVNMRVMDASGRVVDAKTKIGSNSTIQIGASYLSGTYFAEMTQGTTRKVIQLMKIK